VLSGWGDWCDLFFGREQFSGRRRQTGLAVKTRGLGISRDVSATSQEISQKAVSDQLRGHERRLPVSRLQGDDPRHPSGDDQGHEDEQSLRILVHLFPDTPKVAPHR
jgi:hypothetical protein